MNLELKMFYIKLGVLLAITPLLGFGLLRFVEYLEAEILAAGLAFILGTAFPPAHALGWGLLIDGTSRILNGCDELDKQREKHPTPYNNFSNTTTSVR
jgi:hypothetical protein